MLVVTYLEKDRVKFNAASVYNVRELHFQKNLCEAFAEDKKQHYCGDLVLEWAVLQECLLPLVNRISIKTLEKYLPSYILTYSSKRRDLTRN